MRADLALIGLGNVGRRFMELLEERAGRLEAARQSARHAIEVASAAGQRERAAVRKTAAAVWEALYGNAAAAKRNALPVMEVAQ